MGNMDGSRVVALYDCEPAADGIQALAHTKCGVKQITPFMANSNWLCLANNVLPYLIYGGVVVNWVN